MASTTGSFFLKHRKWVQKSHSKSKQVNRQKKKKLKNDFDATDRGILLFVFIL
jgi:hypothetical protein